MANPEWIEIYRSYSDEALAAEIAKLKQQDSVYTSQQVGGKGYSKDLTAVSGKLAAAIRVQKERRQPPCTNPFVGITDFRRIDNR